MHNKAVKDAEVLVESLKRDSVSLICVDQFERSKPFLLPKTVTDLQVKAYSVHEISDKGEKFEAIYLSVTVNASEMDIALKAISEDLNTLSSFDLIHSSLGIVSMALIPIGGERTVVLAIVLVPSDRISMVGDVVEHMIADPSMLGRAVGSLSYPP